MKRILVLTLAMMVAIGSFGFAAGEAEDDELYIAVVSKGFQHEFWQTVRLGAEVAADELGVRMTFDGPATEAMVDQQVNMTENVITAGADALVLAALDVEALVPPVEQAESFGIPVVEFDSGLDSEIPLSLVATNNLEAGALAADKTAELIGESGTVGLVAHDATSQTGIERRDGFLERVEEAYPDIEVLEPVYGEGDHQLSADLATEMITANPDLDAIYATNEGSAVGVAIGVQEAGVEGEVPVVGFDASEQQIELLHDGVLDGFVVQNPFEMGYRGVHKAYRAVHGEGDQLEEFYDTGVTYVTSDNYDDPEVQELLYPFDHYEGEMIE